MHAAGSLGPRTLAGRFAQLEVFGLEHRDAMRRAANDAEIWRYMPVMAIGEGFERWCKWVAHESAKGTQITFAVRRVSDGALVGSTSYLAISPENARVEIGFTWYAADAQGTAINPEAKLLLLTNAFETAGYNRVELKCDARNARSRAAILKLGATEEGTLRQHMWMPAGYYRDSVYYSVLKSEWPAVKIGLENRLSRST